MASSEENLIMKIHTKIHVVTGEAVLGGSLPQEYHPGDAATRRLADNELFATKRL
jgi:hypothetical protein